MIRFLCISASIAMFWGCHAPAENSAVGGNKAPDDEKMVLVLFDFNSGADVSEWKSVNDTVMGGVSSGRMEKSDTGKALFTGTVSLENNGGFASVRGPKLKQAVDEFEGIVVRLKGDGKKYKAGLRTDELFDGVFHQAGFSTRKGAWQEVKIPFTEFEPTYHGRRLSDDQRLIPSKIKSVSFLISDKQQGPFQLEIDWIKAYR
jgi:monofunctional biosynthetic peptidoglycan transglycosylase